MLISSKFGKYTIYRKLLADFEDCIEYCMRELRKWLSRKLYEVKLTCSKYVELNTMFCGNSRKYTGKNRNGYYKALTSVGKKFDQHILSL